MTGSLPDKDDGLFVQHLEVELVQPSLFGVTLQLLNQGSLSASTIGLEASQADNQWRRTRRGAIVSREMEDALVNAVFPDEFYQIFEQGNHMPYASDKQRKYLHSQKPEVAAKMDRDIRAGKKKGTPPKKGGTLPAKVAKPIKGKNRRGSR